MQSAESNHRFSVRTSICLSLYRRCEGVPVAGRHRCPVWGASSQAGSGAACRPPTVEPHRHRPDWIGRYRQSGCGSRRAETDLLETKLSSEFRWSPKRRGRMPDDRGSELSRNNVRLMFASFEKTLMSTGEQNEIN